MGKDLYNRPLETLTHLVEPSFILSLIKNGKSALSTFSGYYVIEKHIDRCESSASLLKKKKSDGDGNDDDDDKDVDKDGDDDDSGDND